MKNDSTLLKRAVKLLNEHKGEPFLAAEILEEELGADPVLRQAAARDAVAEAVDFLEKLRTWGVPS